MKTRPAKFWFAIVLSLVGSGYAVRSVRDRTPLRVLVRDGLGPGQKALDAVCRQSRAGALRCPASAARQAELPHSKTNCGRSVSRHRGWKSRQPGCVKVAKTFRATGVATATAARAPLVSPRLVSARVLEKNRQLCGAGAIAGCG